LGDEPEGESDAGYEDGFLEGLSDETLMVSGDDEVLQGLGVSLGDFIEVEDGSLETVPEVGMLDLSELVDEPGIGEGLAPDPTAESSKPERRPPGFPQGTFDLSEINDETDISREETGRGSVPVSMEGLPDISDEQLERVVERVVRTMFKERIEELIVDAIGKNLSEDIEKMKKMIQDNFS
jgi:hypothetical protein